MSDASYWRQRAESERLAATKSSDPRVKRAHEEMAERYLQRCQEPEQESEHGR